MKSYILGLICLLFCSQNIFAQDSIPLDRVVAIIGNSIVKYSDIQNQLMQMRQEGLPIEDNSECLMLEQIMYQKLLLDQANLDSLEVTDKQVQEEIERRIDIFTEQIGSREKLEKYYGKSVSEIKNEWTAVVKEQLLIQQMQGSIIEDVEVTPNEVRKYYKSLPDDSLPFINPQFEVAQIVIRPQIEFAQKKELKAKLESYRERAINGESFSKLAALYSDDIQSAKKGGDLGFITRAELVPEFAAAGFKLKNGEISRIVETEYGFHIIQCVERKKDKARLRHILLIPKENNEQLQAAKARIDSISLMLKNDSLTFEIAAFQFSEDRNTNNNGGLMANPFTGTSKFDAKQMEPTIYYAIKDMKDGDISEPFITTDETGRKVYKIVRRISSTPAHKASLSEDYNMIKQMALDDKKQNILTDWVEEKQKRCYIKIDKTYRNCEFKYPNWFENSYNLKK